MKKEKKRKPTGVKLTGIIFLVYVFVFQVWTLDGQEQSPQFVV